MADQAERVILEAEDQVTPIVDKANAGLDSFEKKAESSHGKVIRISAPTPGLSPAAICPPWASTMRLAIAMPSPVPFVFVV